MFNKLILSLAVAMVGTQVFAQVESIKYIPQYDSLPASYKARVSREQYERMKNSTTDSLDTEEAIQAERALQKAFSNVRVFEKRFRLLLENEELVEGIGLQPEQIEQIEVLRKKRIADIASAEAELGKISDEFRNEKQRLELAFVQDVREIFARFQFEEMSKWSETEGVPRIVTQTSIGDMLNLNEKQRERIQVKSKDFADELRDIIHQKRLEAATLVYEELTDEQRRKLTKILDASLLNDLNQNSSLMMLLRMHTLGEQKRMLGIESDEVRVWDEK